MEFKDTTERNAMNYYISDLQRRKQNDKLKIEHTDNLRDTIECRANAVIRADLLRDRREARRCPMRYIAAEDVAKAKEI